MRLDDSDNSNFQDRTGQGGGGMSFGGMGGGMFGLLFSLVADDAIKDRMTKRITERHKLLNACLLAAIEDDR